jgi:hypothetical protein
VDAVAVVLPGGQAYPGRHAPSQSDDVAPSDDPNLPGAHGPLHDGVPMPVEAPYRPGAQAVHVAAPEVLKVPAWHTATDALVEAAGHAKPAVQGPLQPALVRPGVAPYLPPGQLVHAPAPPVL